MREIRYEPQKEAAVEKFTVHYDDGTSKEVVNGLMFDMDSEGLSTVYFTNVNAERVVNAAVSVISLCEQFGLSEEMIEVIKHGGMKQSSKDMEVVIDEEPV